MELGKYSTPLKTAIMGELWEVEEWVGAQGDEMLGVFALFTVKQICSSVAGKLETSKLD